MFSFGFKLGIGLPAQQARGKPEQAHFEPAPARDRKTRLDTDQMQVKCSGTP